MTDLAFGDLGSGMSGSRDSQPCLISPPTQGLMTEAVVADPVLSWRVGEPATAHHPWLLQRHDGWSQPIDHRRPIGLFDSGLGGLTVFSQLQRLLPGEPLLYLADSARLPYGGRPPEEIQGIAAEVAQWLRGQHVKAVVMACNTTNALAADVVRRHVGVPVIDLIETTASTLYARNVAVIATSATTASGAYGHALRRRHPSVRVHEIACPAFVPAIEAGDLHSAELQRIAADYLAPVLDESLDALVFGCTHYPMLTPMLKDLLPGHVKLFDPARPVAEAVHHLARTMGFKAGPRCTSPYRFCCTGDRTRFAQQASQWLGISVDVESVTLQSAARVH